MFTIFFSNINCRLFALEPYPFCMLVVDYWNVAVDSSAPKVELIYLSGAAFYCIYGLMNFRRDNLENQPYCLLCFVSDISHWRGYVDEEHWQIILWIGKWQFKGMLLKLLKVWIRREQSSKENLTFHWWGRSKIALK